ncbi:MAG: cobalamin-independent methionine synthase II family protein [Chloroflexi bacterium]|nr:cobalamin-independent methionine synthase II family protein [Chloroflexota bacterium]
MLERLPLLPTTVVGSHGIPGWLVVARQAAARGEFGPTDLEELYADATQLAILDQERAGIDVLSDGEMRRLHFVQGFYGRLYGLEPLPVARKLGAPGYDMVPQYRAVERITLRPPEAQDPSTSSGEACLTRAEGLGIVEEFVFARRLTQKPLKVTCPGPLMFALQIQPDGGPYRDRFEIAADLAQLINQELHRCADAGARIVQLDDPSFSFHRSGADAVFAPTAAVAVGEIPAAEPPPAGALAELYNLAVAGLRERGVKLLLHLCFGNFHGRPRTARSYRTLFPAVLAAQCDQFVLEFAGRELAQLDLWQEFGIDRELGAGVVDVKAFYPESAAQVAGRVRRLLAHVSAEKLWLNPDCGFNHSARWVCAAKLRALVEGACLVRTELAGATAGATPGATQE